MNVANRTSREIYIRDYFRPYMLQRGTIGLDGHSARFCSGLFKPIALRGEPARLLELRAVTFRDPPQDRRVVNAAVLRWNIGDPHWQKRSRGGRLCSYARNKLPRYARRNVYLTAHFNVEG